MDSRMKIILTLLINSSSYIKKEELVNRLDISAQTITRLFKDLNYFLTQYEIRIIHKRNLGFYIDGEDGNLDKLREQIVEKRTQKFTSKERQIVIFTELFSSSSPVKIYYLSYVFKCPLRQ